MKQPAAGRITADVCFLFMLFSFFASKRMYLYGRGLWIPVCFACAVFACASLAVRLEHPVLRILLALPPGLLVFCCKTTAMKAALLCALIYVVFSLAAGRFVMDLSVYRPVYLLCAALCALFGIFALAGLSVAPGVMLFATAYLLLGLLTLRRIRTGARMEASWEAVNVLGVALPVAGASLLCAGLYAVLRHGTKLWELILTPLASIFYFLSRIWVWFGEGLRRIQPVQKPQEHGTVNIPGDDSVVELPPEEGMPEMQYFDFHVDRRILIAIVVIAAAALIVWLLLRYVRLGRSSQDELRAYEKTTPFRFAGRGRASAADAAGRKGNAGRIRKLYRQYLNHLRVHGMAIRKYHTSRDILTAAEQGALSPDEERLREIYLVARYGGDERISSGDIEEAQALVEAIRESSRQASYSPAGKEKTL